VRRAGASAKAGERTGVRGRDLGCWRFALKMRRILVVGAKGMLGRDLMEVLHSSMQGDEVVGWDIEEIDIEKRD